MTAMAHEPYVPEVDLLQDFLDLELPEGYRAELIDEEIFVTTPPHGDHEDLVARLLNQIAVASATRTRMLAAPNKGLELPRGDKCPKNHVIPDATIAPAASNLFRGAGSWMPPEGVAMVAEVAFSSPQRDRVAKRHCYAMAGIPLYLLVDRAKRTVFLHSGPEGDDYQQAAWVPFGKPLALPEPFGFELDTADFL